MPSVNTARRRARRPGASRQLRRSRSRRPDGAEDRGVVCLVVCGILFVLLVAVKLLFPETAERMSGAARQIISQDADFQEAFAAVGRMVSGESPASDALQDAYIAVFNPGSDAISGTAGPVVDAQGGNDGPRADPNPEPIPAPAPVPAGQNLLRQTVLSLPDAEKTVMRELVLFPAGEGDAALPGRSVPEESMTGSDAISGTAGPDTDTGTASYIYTMAALPENASLEQRNLGFEHCTPVQGRLTSTFGWREHPVEGGNRFHYGVDLGAATGTDILAFADGEVYAVGESSSLGNYIMLRHEGGYITLYGHCSRVTATGGSVAKGEKIAEVGATGIVTGPHLHFELHDGDLRLNPIYYVAVG